MKRISAFLAFLAIASAVFGQAQNANVPPGSSLTFTATADGFPAPSFEWFHNGVKIATGAVYRVATVGPDTAGQYTVKATNIEGSATSDPVTITTHKAPGKPVVTITATAAGVTTTSTATRK